LPLLLSIFGDLCGGILTDRVTARFGLRTGRCGVGGVAYLIAALGLLTVPFCANPILAAILIAVAVAASMCTLAAAWSTCIDIAGNNAATVSATMNTAGQIGSFFCPLIVAYSLKWFQNHWNIPIFLMGFLFLLGAVCWCLIDPRKTVFGQQPNL
jgi:MFS family permease